MRTHTPAYVHAHTRTPLVRITTHAKKKKKKMMSALLVSFSFLHSEEVEQPYFCITSDFQDWMLKCLMSEYLNTLILTTGTSFLPFFCSSLTKSPPVDVEQRSHMAALDCSSWYPCRLKVMVGLVLSSALTCPSATTLNVTGEHRRIPARQHFPQSLLAHKATPLVPQAGAP